MDQELSFDLLNEEQIKKICNGCGGKGGWFDPPDFMFEASCDHHDFNYWLGCSEADRKKADQGFYEAMKRDVTNLPWFRKPLAYWLAFNYYMAVRICGKDFFYYAEKKRGWNDL
jgi:hypothetical protein